MNSLYLILIITTILLLAPFLFAYLHYLYRKPCGAVSILLYRYFAIFNIVLSGMAVVVRVLSQHYLNTAYDLVGAAILSMVIFTLITLWRKDILMLAPALLWSIFVFLGAAFHLQELYHQVVDERGILVIHVIYDVLVATILLILFAKITKAKYRLCNE